jgi:hypothetical protein
MAMPAVSPQTIQALALKIQRRFHQSAPRANVRWNTCLGRFRVQVGHEHDLIAEIFYEWIV